MIRIIYDPRLGRAYPDSWSMHIAESTAHEHATNGVNRELCVSTSHTLYAFRVLVRRKTIALDEIQFFYRKPTDDSGPENDIPIQIYPDGGLDPWPSGFCDDMGHMLMELL